MKNRLYKPVITFFTLCFLGTIFGQKFENKFTENFIVNKDVEVVIDASNTEINVTTWDKNEVLVEAFVEVEGLSKEEAEKYFKDWNFEALGNKSKVQVTSKGNSSFGIKNDFIIFNEDNWVMPKIDIPNLEDIAESIFIIPNNNYYDIFSGLDSITDESIVINIDSSHFPEINFDFDNLLETLDDLEDNMKKDGKYSFEYHDDDEHIVIKSKKEWEKFKKSKEYKKLKVKLQQSMLMKKRGLLKSKRKIRKLKLLKRKAELAKAKLEFKNNNKEEIKKALEKVKETFNKINFSFSSDSDNVSINGKKIKVKKRLKIKVPKKATFNLNTHHCKVKLPNTIASGNVKYGTFDANNLNGGKLTIEYSPVNINDLNACTLFLNNVTDAKISSVTNTKMSNNSSGVNIIRINENVNLSDEFGELLINSFNPNFGEFVLNLSQSNATITLGDVVSEFKYDVNRVKLEDKRVGKSIKNSSKNTILVNGEFSNIIIK